MSHHDLETHELQQIISSSYCWNDVLTKLNMKTMTRSLQRRLKKDTIDYSNISSHFDGLHTRFNRFSVDELQNILKIYNKWEDIIKVLGYKSYYYIETIKKKLDALNISYEHIQYPDNVVIKKTHKYTLEDILVEDSAYTDMRLLLRRLKQEKGWEHLCSVCNLSVWNDRPIPLELDHKNGNHTDNTYSNLRTICPNCHAQTDTYKGKNMRICKENKEKQIENPPPPKKEPKEPREPNYCACSKEINYRNTQCNQCKARTVFESGIARKTERPSYEALQQDLQQMSMVKVGAKYGVSDNAIRKWLRLYEKYHLNE
jgi:hypothetical protein